MPVAPSYTSIKSVDGLTVYAVYRHVSDLNYWNTFTGALESFIAGHWYSGASNNYAVAATKNVQSSNVVAEYYVGVPSMPAGVYFVEWYAQQGSNPAASDGQPFAVTYDLKWNGTTILPSVNVAGNEIADVGTNINTSALQAIATEVMDLPSAIDPGTVDTLREAIRLILASVAGKLSGAGTTTIAIRDTADTKNRLSVTCDGSGNRTAITYDVT